MNNRDKVLWGAGVAVLAAGAGAAAIAATQKAGTDPKLRQVAAFDHQVTGISVSAEGRIFVNFPRWTEDAPVSVGELLSDGTLRPYPDARWNSWRNARANAMSVDRHFVCVQSIVCDGHGNLWVLDPGAPGNERILPGAPKLVKVDLATDRVTQTILFDESVALQGTYLNDIRFSPDGKTGYITDSGAVGAIIVVDLESGAAWRALDGHAATQPEKDVTVMIDGAPLVRPDGRQPTFAADGIAISNDGATLFFQALTGRTLYSIDTAKLARDVSEDDRGAAVTRVGISHVSDGFWMSKAGALYLTSPTDNSVRRWADGASVPVVRDKRLRWPDTMSEGPDGTLYVTASHIQDTNWFKPSAPPAIRTELFAFRP